MGSHRAEPHAPGRRRADRSEAPPVDPEAPVYVGRRRAAPAPVEPAQAVEAVEAVEAVVVTPAPVPTAPAPVAPTAYVGRRAARVAAPEAAPEAPSKPAEPAAPYVGRRAARPAAAETADLPAVVPTVLPAVAPVVPEAVVRAPAAETAEVPVVVTFPPVEALVADTPLEVTTEIAPVAVRPAGQRRAVRHAGRRGPLFKALPSVPVLVGVAAMALTVVGVVAGGDPNPAGASEARYNAVGALTGSSGSATVDSTRATVSRDSDRDTLEAASGAQLVEEADAQAEQRDARLGELADQAESQADKLALNQWQLPLTSYHLTARFGEVGLWATYHTGLDFAAPSGTPIYAVANGTVTSAGYDGAYGNKTVVTLDDGTELWYCHQTSFAVSPGQVVNAGDLLGYVGATGNVTGPHLHLEVRPGGGDPVDPDAALREHGVIP